jgi:hypothetical protein
MAEEMFDLDAPIVPGKGAAGISLGSPMQSLLTKERPEAVDERRGCTRYDFGVVRIWVGPGGIDQVGVSRGYRGALDGIIRIDHHRENQSSLRSIGRGRRGRHLVVPGSPGWCFETEQWIEGRILGQNRKARVVEIYVFPAAV